MSETTLHLRDLYREKDLEESTQREWVTCENCRKEVLRYIHVPVYDYIGCLDCYQEAMAVLQRLEAETLKRKPLEMAPASVRDEVRLFFSAGVTVDQYRAYKMHFDGEVA